MLAASTPVAFVASTDILRAKTFYERVLGLRLRQEDDFAAVFDLNGMTLRVSRVEQLSPAPFTVLGWAVNDAPAVVRQLGEKGVAFERVDGLPQDQLGIWRTPDGSQVAWFKDPDGNLLSVTQIAS
jgi:predicted enzyme related to lactoylglutathione lyase